MRKMLKYCIRNIKYKLAVMNKNHLGTVRRDNDLDLFIITRYKGVSQKKIFIIVDLETLYSDSINAPKEMRSVRDGVYKILDGNQSKHTRLLSSLFERKTDVNACSDTVQKKKEVIEGYLKQLEILLSRVSDAEKEKLETLSNAHVTRRGVIGISSMYNDIDKSHETHKIEKDLDNIIDIKHQIISDIVHLRTMQENLTLEIDKILFENTVMIHKINANLDKLNGLK